MRLCMDEKSVEKIINSKVVEKVYDDTLSSPLSEVSKIGVDLAKTARLVLAPLQLAATFQDRFELFLQELNRRVEPENQLQIPAQVSSVCVNNMKHLETTNPLWKMFSELLIKAADREQQAVVHPCFATIISQLAPDEAVFLYELSKVEHYDIEDSLELNLALNRFENRQTIKSNIPNEKLVNPEALTIYYSHLSSLSLVSWPLLAEEPVWDDGDTNNRKQLGTKRKSKILLTEFGHLFVKACIPEQGLQ